MPLCTKSLAISANCVVGAAYGLQFFLAPGFTIEQNFKVVPDKYHKFMGRFTGGLVDEGSVPSVCRLTPCRTAQACACSHSASS